jgi:hypothetical protein
VRVWPQKRRNLSKVPGLIMGCGARGETVMLLQIRLMCHTGFDEAEVSQRAIHAYGILYLVESSLTSQ